MTAATPITWDRRKRKRAAKALRQVFAYAVTTAFAVLFTMPFLWMESLSLKTPPDLVHIPPRFIPKPIDWHNYVEAMRMPMRPFSHFLRNTAYYTAFALVGQVLSSTLVAYGFARMRAPGRDFMFVLLLSTMMLPSQVLIIPQFIIFKELGWLNTFKPLIIPAYLGSALYIFLMRQFMHTIPDELLDAARIDGASEPYIFHRIVMPLCFPALSALGIFVFRGSWDSFLWPLVVLSEKRLYTLPLGLKMFVNEYYTEQGPVMAGTAIAVIPVIIVFLLLQRRIVEGISLTGIKG